MGEKNITLKIDGEEKSYPAGISFLKIAEEYREKAAKVGLFPVTAVREYSATAV